MTNIVISLITYLNENKGMYLCTNTGMGIQQEYGYSVIGKNARGIVYYYEEREANGRSMNQTVTGLSARTHEREKRAMKKILLATPLKAALPQAKRSERSAGEARRRREARLRARRDRARERRRDSRETERDERESRGSERERATHRERERTRLRLARACPDIGTRMRQKSEARPH